MPDSDLDLLLSTLREAGQIALRYHGTNPKQWYKPDGTMVTEADLRIDDFLKSTILKARPDDGWLSEETPDNLSRLEKSRLWIADPIDGTRAFAAGTHFWGMGMALAENGFPLLSGIYCPVDDVMYHAVKGGGAFRNNIQLTSPDSTGPVIVQRKAAPAVEELGLPTAMASRWPMLLHFALIAQGDVPAVISIGDKQDWDLAAGVLLVTETGGHVTTPHGAAMRFNQLRHQQPGLVAAQAKWHSRLIEAIGNM